MALEELDIAFTLPDTIENAQLRQLYEVLVHRMRHEAKHLPMNTVQQLLIERIAYNYVVMRARENGELGGFAHATVQKDFNTFWLSMTAEFNRLLGKGEPMSNLQRKAVLNEVRQIIITTLSSGVQDPKLRTDLVERMATAFDAAGI